MCVSVCVRAYKQGSSETMDSAPIYPDPYMDTPSLESAEELVPSQIGSLRLALAV